MKTKKAVKSVNGIWIGIGIGICIILALCTNYFVIMNLKTNTIERTSGTLYRDAEEYLFPDILKDSEDQITQYFKPAHAGLQEIHIRLAFNHARLLETYDSEVRITLKDSGGEIIQQETVNKQEIQNWHYYALKIEDELSAGDTYSITIEQVTGPYDAETGKYMISWVPFIYPAEQELVTENVFCEQGGVRQEYQWDLYYVYRGIDEGKQVILFFADILLLLFVVVVGRKTCRQENTRGKATFLWLTPIIWYVIIETITGNIATIGFGYCVINILIGYLLLIIFVGILNIKAGVIFGYALLTILALVEYYVYKLRGRSFMMQDIASLKTATAIMGGYTYDIEMRAGIAILVSIAMIAVLFIMRWEWKLPEKGNKAWLVKIASIIGCVLLTGTLLNQEWMQHITFMNLNMWDIESNYREKGFLRTLLSEIQYLKEKAPEGYSVEEVAEISDSYAEKYDNRLMEQNIQPENVIVIMNESWADFRYISEFHGSDTITPYIDSMSENVIKGAVHVPIFGAGTANSEYEVLTGNSMQFLNPSNIAYQLYISDDEYGMANIFKNNGYRTIALHPNLADNWNRDKVYPKMDFEEFISGYDWPGAEFIRWCMSDESSYNRVIDIYENKAEGEKVFSFLVTMQNHGGYDWEEYESSVDLGYEEQYPLTEQYLSLIRESDQAFEKLIHHFENVDEPTMIVMFGDHLPNIDQEFYDKLFGESAENLQLLDKQKMYTTPYVIWANYDIPEMDLELSSNYLGTYIMYLAGIKLPDYQKCLYEFMQSVPVIGMGMIMDAEGNWYHMEEVPEDIAKILQDYEMLQYNNIFDGNRIDSIFTLE